MENSNIIIVIPIEIKIREFLSKLYLALQIVQNSNFKVIIGGQRFLTRKIFFKNCIWIDKNTQPKHREKYPIHLDNKILMLDEEGPICFQHKSIIKERYYLKLLCKQVDMFLFSGKFDLKKINYRKIKKKTSLIGNIKLNFLNSNLNKVFFKENLYIRKKYKNYIFITGHYPSAIVRTQDEWIKSVTRNILGNTGNLSRHISSKIKFNNLRKKNYISLLELTKKIAKDNPQRNVVFRKHPLESFSFIKKYFKNKPKNLKIIYKYSVTPWIANSALHIHAGCQSSLETIKLKKKLVTYMPYYTKECFSIYRNFKPFFFNEKKCLEFIKYKKKNTKFSQKKLNNISLSFSKNCLAKNLIKIINKNFKNLKSEIIYKVHTNNINDIFKINLFRVGSYVKSIINNNKFIRNILIRNYLPMSITKHDKNVKFKKIGNQEIKKLIIAFKNKKNFTKDSINVKKLSDSTFLISRNEK